MILAGEPEKETMETLLATPGLFALFLGVVLLIISVIGGELEIKEFKIPKLGKNSRIIISVTGLALIGGGCLLSAGGIYLTYLSKRGNSAQVTPQSAAQKIEIHIDTAKINQQLPTDASIPAVMRDAIATLFANADQAEINAVYYKDKSYLTSYYAGDALAQMENEVDNALSSSDTVLYVYNQEKSYFVAIRQLDSAHYSIDACEYWSTEYYDSANSALLTTDPEELFPQTVVIEDQNGKFYLTSITNYSGNVFCTK